MNYDSVMMQCVSLDMTVIVKIRDLVSIAILACTE